MAVLVAGTAVCVGATVGGTAVCVGEAVGVTAVADAVWVGVGVPTRLGVAEAVGEETAVAVAVANGVGVDSAGAAGVSVGSGAGVAVESAGPGGPGGDAVSVDVGSKITTSTKSGVTVPITGVGVRRSCASSVATIDSNSALRREPKKRFTSMS